MFVLRTELLWSVLAGGAVATAACNLSLEKTLFAPNPDGYSEGSGGGGGGSAAGGSSTGSGMGDIPCDVAAVLETHCDSCHAANIPPLLRTRAEFMGPADSDSSKSMAEVSLERMENTASPMPPDGVPPAADVQVFADWLAAGLPAGECGGGSGGSGGSPYDVAPTCSSGEIWDQGDSEGRRMYPGQGVQQLSSG